LVNDVALGLGSFSGETLLCANTTGVSSSDRRPPGLVVFPTAGDGSFTLQWPNGFLPNHVEILDMQCRRVSRMAAASQVRLPAGMAVGSYVVRLVNADGRSMQARYELR
jgi:hypothetical protein